MDCEIHEGIWHYIQMHAVMYVRSQQQKEVAAFPENKPLGTHSNPDYHQPLENTLESFCIKE